MDLQRHKSRLAREQLARAQKRQKPLPHFEVLSLACRLLDIQDGDTVIDFGGTNGGLIDCLATLKINHVRYVDLRLDGYPKSEQGVYLDNRRIAKDDVDFLNVKDEYGITDAKVLGIYMKDFGNRVANEATEQRLSEITDRQGAAPMRQLLGCDICRLAAGNGKAVVLVPHGRLSISMLAPARARICEHDRLERIIKLGPHSFVDAPIAPALLCLGRKKVDVVTQADCTKYECRRPRKVANYPLEHSIPAIANGKHDTPIDVEQFCNASGIIPFEATTKNDNASKPLTIGDVAKIQTGLNLHQSSIRLKRAAGSSKNLRFINPSDFISGEVTPEGEIILAPIDPARILRYGDILVPRAGTVFDAMLLGLDCPGAWGSDKRVRDTHGSSLVAGQSFVVIRVTDESIYRPYLLAFLNSSSGTRSTLSGGNMPHTGSRSLSALVLPQKSFQEQMNIGDAYLKGMERAQTARRNLDKALQELSDLADSPFMQS